MKSYIGYGPLTSREKRHDSGVIQNLAVVSQ